MRTSTGGAPEASTIAGLTVAVAAPALPLALTSCYLARSDAALAVSHLRLTADEETFSQYVIAPARLHATLAGACLLEHAAALRDAAADITAAAITVDVDPDTLDRVAETWGPTPPPG